MSRTFLPEAFDDEWFGTLDCMQQVLWFGLLMRVADDQGRFVNNPVIIKSKVFPYKEDVSSKQIRECLDKFSQAKKLHAYTFGLNGATKDCLQIVNWWRYQRSSRWMSGSNLQPPVGWTDRIHCHTSGNQILDLNWDKPGGFDFTVQQSVQPTVQRLYSREVEVKVEDEVKSEDEVNVEANKKDLTDLMKTCGIPAKFHGEILKHHELGRTDILAELTRNFSRTDKVKNPGVITAMNLAKGEIAGQEWYEEKRWTKYLPILLLKKLGIDYQDEILAIQNGGDTDYTQYEENEQNAWESAKVLLAEQMGPGTFTKWVKDTRLVEFAGGVLNVECRDHHCAEWLTDHIKKTAENILHGICQNEGIVVNFSVTA